MIVGIGLNTQYVLLASDGIFDAVSNNEIDDVIRETAFRFKDEQFCEFSKEAVNNVIKLALYNGSEDNISVILIALKDLQKENGSFNNSNSKIE